MNFFGLALFSLFFISAFLTTHVSGANCTLVDYVNDLSTQISQMACVETKLANALIALNATTPNGTSVFTSRNNQLKKVSNAKNLLNLELSAIKSKCASSPSTMVCSFAIPLTADNSTIGRSYVDVSFASSCFSYRYPQSPYRFNDEGSGFYQIKIGANVYSVYCDMETMGGGWTLTMKTSSHSAYSYSHAVWTNADVPSTQKNLTSLTLDEDYVSPAFYKLTGNESMLAMGTLQYYNSWSHFVGTARDLSNGAMYATNYITNDVCAAKSNCGFQPVNKKPLGIWQAMPYNYITPYYFRFGYANAQTVTVAGWGGYIRVGFSCDGDLTDSSDTTIGLGIDCLSTCSSNKLEQLLMVEVVIMPISQQIPLHQFGMDRSKVGCGLEVRRKYI